MGRGRATWMKHLSEFETVETRVQREVDNKHRTDHEEQHAPDKRVRKSLQVEHKHCVSVCTRATANSFVYGGSCGAHTHSE